MQRPMDRLEKHRCHPLAASDRAVFPAALRAAQNASSLSSSTAVLQHMRHSARNRVVAPEAGDVQRLEPAGSRARGPRGQLPLAGLEPFGVRL